MNKVFVTGCDSHTEWMLPWFIENYKKRNTLPIVFVDFGVTPMMLEWCKIHFYDVVTLPSIHSFGCRWFLKPEAILSIDGVNKVWLDTDCEVLGNLSNIFDLLQRNKLNMIPDGPWTRRSFQKWHNSGVVGVINNPEILHIWGNECRINNTPFGPTHRGDQEVLHHMIQKSDRIGIREIYINDLPLEYNTLRLDVLDKTAPPNPLIVHWTGAKGKDEIRRKMK